MPRERGKHHILAVLYAVDVETRGCSRIDMNHHESEWNFRIRGYFLEVLRDTGLPLGRSSGRVGRVALLRDRYMNRRTPALRVAWETGSGVLV